MAFEHPVDAEAPRELYHQELLRAPHTPPTPTRRWGWVWVGLSALTGLGAGLAVGAPAAFERFAARTVLQLSERLGLVVDAEHVEWTFGGDVSARKVSVRSLDPALGDVDSLLATIERADLSLSPSLLKGRATLDSLHVSGVDSQFVRTPDGKTNIDSILSRLNKGASGVGTASHRRLSWDNAEISVSQLRVSLKHGFQGLSKRLRLPERLELRQGNLSFSLGKELSQLPLHFQDTNLDPGFGVTLSFALSQEDSAGLPLGPLGTLEAFTLKPERALRVWLGDRVLGASEFSLSPERIELKELLLSKPVKDLETPEVEAALAASRVSLHGKSFNDLSVLRSIRDALVKGQPLRPLLPLVEVDGLTLTVAMEELNDLIPRHLLTPSLDTSAVSGTQSLVQSHDALALSLTRFDGSGLSQDAPLDQRWAHLFARVDRALETRLERFRHQLTRWVERSQHLPDVVLTRARIIATQADLGLIELRNIGIDARSTPGQERLRLSFEHPFGEGNPKVEVDSTWSETPRVQLTLQALSFERLQAQLKQVPLKSGTLERLQISVNLGAKGMPLVLEGSLKADGLMLAHPALAHEPVGPFPLEVAGHARWDRTTGSLSIGELALKSQAFEFSGEMAIHSALSRPKFYLSLDLKEAPLQELWRSIPRPFIPLLHDAELSGHLGWALRVMLDTADVDNLRLDSEPKPRNVAVHTLGSQVDFQKLRRAHTYTIRLRDGSAGQRVVGPNTAAWVHLADISPYLPLALTTTEDGTFATNPGISTFAMRESLATNLKRDGFVRGASTITQQLVKNLYLSGQKTLSRKFQEIAIAWQMSLNLSKNEVMALYLNTIEFGPGIYGVGDASWHYFGKRAIDLTLSEAVFLASIVPSPRKYHAFFEQGALTPRWQGYVETLMKVMVQRSKITPEEHLQAAPYEVRFRGHGGGYRSSGTLEDFDQIPEHEGFSPTEEQEE